MNILKTYHIVHALRDYFSNESYLQVESIIKVMARNKMYKIRTALHFSDISKAVSRDDNHYDSMKNKTIDQS